MKILLAVVMSGVVTLSHPVWAPVHTSSEGPMTSAMFMLACLYASGILAACGLARLAAVQALIRVGRRQR